VSAELDPSSFLRALNQQLRPRVLDAGTRALVKAAHHVIGEAQQLAPMGGGIYSPNDPNPGELRDSAYVRPPVGSGTANVSVEIGFTAIHAAVQHERLDFRHDNGQAKYLETAMQKNQQKVRNYILAEMRKAVSG